MLVGNKAQICQTIVRFQVLEKPTQPRRLAMCIWPDLDVLIYTGKNRTAELELWVNLMEGRGPLQIKRCVIFRQHELPVRFFAHFYVGDRIATLGQIGEFGSAVFGICINHRNGNHRGQMIGDTAGKKQIKAGLNSAKRPGRPRYATNR